MFDGNTVTWTDTTTKSCTNTVLPADGIELTVVGVKYLPKDSVYLRPIGEVDTVTDALVDAIAGLTSA